MPIKCTVIVCLQFCQHHNGNKSSEGDLNFTRKVGMRLVRDDIKTKADGQAWKKGKKLDVTEVMDTA